MNTLLSRIAVVATVSALLPAQALAQTAPTTTPPVKAVVVVQQSEPAAQSQPQMQMPMPAQPPTTGKAQVVVQTPSAPAAQAPAAPGGKPATLPAPNLTVDVPATASLGQAVMIRVALVGPDASPVSGATVDFSSGATFLNTQSSVVFAHAVTDTQGTASVDWQPRSDGSLTLNASFAGDKRFAAASANTKVEVKGDQQLYQQHAGVVLPGLNAAPPLTATAALAPVASPWPRMSGWPLVVVLVIVWSLYARAVTSLFTIARNRTPKTASREAR